MTDNKQIEKSKDKKNNTILVITISAATFCILVFFLIFALITTKVEIETEGWCNSGYIGLDIEGYNNIQNKTCTKPVWDNVTQSYKDLPDPEMENITCFIEDYQLKHVKLKDINGLNCEGKAKVKMPFILSILWGGIYE